MEFELEKICGSGDRGPGGIEWFFIKLGWLEKIRGN